MVKCKYKGFASRAEYQRHWRRKNPASNAASQKKYYQKNKAKFQRYSSQWTRDNKSRLSERRKRFRAANLQNVREKGRIAYHKNKVRILSTRKLWRLKNLAHCRAQAMTYYVPKIGRKADRPKFNSREEHMAYRKSKKRASMREYERKMRRENMQFLLKKRLSSRILNTLKRRGTYKTNKTVELLGCSLKQLKAHIESQFKEGMSWANRQLWHIDHIRPCASFDLTVDSQQKECFNYKNLQPLWSLENMRKGAKWN